MNEFPGGVFDYEMDFYAVVYKLYAFIGGSLFATRKNGYFREGYLGRTINQDHQIEDGSGLFV